MADPLCKTCNDTRYRLGSAIVAPWNRCPDCTREALFAKIAWFQARLDLLLHEQGRMRRAERTLLCDIIANGALLPDPDGKRYGDPHV